MIEYFYSDIIIDPTSKDAGNLIGKEVYASLIPARCLMIANGRCKRTYRCFLESLEPKSTLPFYVKVIEADNPRRRFLQVFPLYYSQEEVNRVKVVFPREVLE